MEIQGYFTGKGLALSTKLLTGAALAVTRVVAGGGSTADPLAATSLPQPKQTLAVNPPSRSGNTATLPVTLAAALAREAYTLTELGVYASDPDEGEILYKVYRLGEPVDIKPDSRMVLRFYLEETVSQDLNVIVACSPAGLVTEADFAPVRDKVRADFVPFRTVLLSAPELPAYAAALPRLLTEHLTLRITGALEEPLLLSGFYGSGSILIDAVTPEDCVIRNTVRVSDCTAGIALKNLTFASSQAVEETYYQAAVSALNVRQITVGNSSFTGNGAGRAVLLANGSSGWLGDCSIRNFQTALASWAYSTLGANDVAASGNTYGAHVYNGGTILLCGTTPELVGGTTNCNSDGLIARNGKTL